MTNAMEVRINNTPLSYRGMALLNGSLNNLLKPVEYKALTINENAMMHGSRALLANRRKKSRDVVVNFLVKGSDPRDLQNKINSLIKELVIANNGVTRLTITDLGITFNLVYMSCDKYSGLGPNSATLSIKFKELNPNNRV